MTNKLQFTFGEINDVIIKKLNYYNDNRGWLAELFREDEIKKEFLPQMGYISMTKPGIVRGPHEHTEQADMIAFFSPSNFKLFLWDNRKTSPTYLNKKVFEVGEAFPCTVIIPAGVIHAYKNISDKESFVYNFPNKLYAGKNKKEKIDEVRHESDPNSPFKIDE